MVANLDTNTFKIPIVNVTGTKTLALTDANTVQDCTNAALMTISIPTNATVAFPVGTQIAIKRRSTLGILIAGAVGVTVVDDQGTALGIGAQVEFFGRLYKLGTDSWQLIRSIPDNPILPGNNATAFTQALNNNSTRVATTAYVNTSNRPFLSLSMTTSQTGLTEGSWFKVIYNNVVTDTGSIYTATTGNIVIPTGLGGLYLFSGGLFLTDSSQRMFYAVCTATLGDIVPGGIIAHKDVHPNDIASALSGSKAILLTAGTTYTIQAFYYSTTNASNSVVAPSPWNTLALHRLNV